MSKKKAPISTKGREMELLKTLVNAERYITTDTFIEIGNKSILSRWEKSGYVERTQPGLLYVTDAFYKEARLRTTPAIKRSSSSSPEHSSGIINALKLMPKMPFQDERGQRLIQNSQEIKDDFKDLKQTHEYTLKDAEIRERFTEGLKTAQETFDRAMAGTDTQAIEKASMALTTAREMALRAEDMSKPIVSTPDLTVRMSQSEMLEYAQNLRDHEAEITNWSGREAYEKAAEKLEQIAATVSGGGRVEIAIEITTANYDGADILQHEAYTDVTETEVIFLPVR